MQVTTEQRQVASTLAPDMIRRLEACSGDASPLYRLELCRQAEYLWIQLPSGSQADRLHELILATYRQIRSPQN